MSIELVARWWRRRWRAGGWGFIWCEERSYRERGRGGDLHTSARGKRHGIEPESDEDYKV